ncbi:hypothetical protein KAJ27_00695 [bacterium]|nr:hypothetical protein [bacterium]
MLKKIIKFGILILCLLLILSSIVIFYTDQFINIGFIKSFCNRNGFTFKKCSGSLSDQLIFSKALYSSGFGKMNINKIVIKLKHNGFSIMVIEPDMALSPESKSKHNKFKKGSFWKFLISDLSIKNGQLHWLKNNIIEIHGNYVDSTFKFSGLYNKLKVNCSYYLNQSIKIKFDSIPVKSPFIMEKVGSLDLVKKLNGNISVSVDYLLKDCRTVITMRSDKENRLSFDGFRISELSLIATFLSETPGISNMEILHGKIGTIDIKGKREIEGFTLVVTGVVNPEDHVILNEIIHMRSNGITIESLNKVDVKVKINDDNTVSLAGDLSDVELKTSELAISGSNFHLEYSGGNFKISTKRSTVLVGSTSICWKGYIESLKFPYVLKNKIKGELKSEIEIIDMKIKKMFSGNEINCLMKGTAKCKIHDKNIELDVELSNKGDVLLANGSKLKNVDCAVNVVKNKVIMTGKANYKNGQSRLVKLCGEIDFSLNKIIVGLLQKNLNKEFINSTSFRLDTYDEPLENFKNYFPAKAIFDKKSGLVTINGFMIDGYGKYSFILSKTGKIDRSFVINGYISLGKITRKCPLFLEMKLGKGLNIGNGRVKIGEMSHIDFKITKNLINDITGKVTLKDMRELLVKDYEVMDYIPDDLKVLLMDLKITYTKNEVRMIFSGKGGVYLELTYKKSEGKYGLSNIRIKKQIPLKYKKFKLLSDVVFQKDKAEVWILPFKASLHGYQIKSAISLRRKLKIKFSSEGYMLQDFILALHKDGNSDYYGVVKGDLKWDRKEIQLLISGEKIDIMEISRLNNIKVLNIEGNANLYLKVNYGREKKNLSTNGKIEIFVPPHIGFGHIIVNQFNPEILKFINPEVFNKIPFKKIYADFKFNRELGIDVNSIKMTGPVINLVGHGALDVDGKIDFSFSAGMSSRLSDGIKEKQFKKFKSLFYRSGNFIVDFSLAGSVYYPKFIPNFSGKTYKYFLKNIYRDPNILLKILFSF